MNPGAKVAVMCLASAIAYGLFFHANLAPGTALVLSLVVGGVAIAISFLPSRD